MKKHCMLPVDIQLFAENPPAETPPDGTPPPAENPPKTFTQEEVNGIVAKESKSAVEKLLKDAGIAPEGDYKASIKAFKTWQDSQKTEIETAFQTDWEGTQPSPATNPPILTSASCRCSVE